MNALTPIFRNHMLHLRLITFLLVLIAISASGQDTLRYSYSELFDLIEKEEDTIFRLEHAVIYTNPETDGSFIVDSSLIVQAMTDKILAEEKQIRTVHKQIEMVDVLFEYSENWGMSNNNAFISFVHFKKPVSFKNAHGLKIYGCTFDNSFEHEITENYSSDFKTVFFLNNTFHGNSRFRYFANNNEEYVRECQIAIFGNRFISKSKNTILYIGCNSENFHSLTFNGNNIGADIYHALNFLTLPNGFEYRYNTINSYSRINFSFGDLPPEEFIFTHNEFKKVLVLDITNFHPDISMEWNQFSKGIISDNGYLQYFRNLPIEIIMDMGRKKNFISKKSASEYLTKYRIENREAYNDEMALLGSIYNFYKGAFNKSDANEVYIEIKDLETLRLHYQYETNPTFNGYFKWKMNQFLKIFSDYGTNPTKSIIFSIYVILIFGAIYLFFPNSWDYHGKYRIVHRYGFLMQYMTRTAGIQDIYLERRQRDFEEHEKFEAIITDSQNKVPKFFTFSARLLNKWAKADSVLVAFLLKRVDVLKGKWVDLSKGKRRWKSVLLTLMLVIGIIYDIFIKILNALMLSINTFTTLGFGEIPIKGLPRYLAIVQGFIGWFLLTIFSVSLISQLME